MVNVIQLLRSATRGNRPSAGVQPYGAPYVNFADMQIGAVDSTQTPQDLVGVPFFSTLANYGIGQPVNYQGKLYTARVAITAGAWTPASWSLVDPSGYAPLASTMAYSGMQINGSMDVSQENGTSVAAVPAGGITKYLIDGFKIDKTGISAWTAQQVASVFPGYVSALKLAVTTAQASIGSDYVFIGAPIEGYRFQRAMWGTASALPVTVGLWVKSSVPGSLLLHMVNNALTSFIGASATITAANTAQWVTATFAATTSDTWLTTNGIGAMLRIYPANASSINVAATNGNTFEITGLVVLPGTQAPTAAQSPLIMRPYDQELLTCQRYFRQQAPEGAGIAASNAQAFFLMRHYGMRATPTVSATAALVISNIATANFPQSTPNAGGSNINADWGEYTVGNFTGLTAGSLYQFRPDVSGGRIRLDARL
jgi:hypothetical protein